MSQGPVPARAAALNGLGVIVILRGEHARACDLFAEAVELYQQAGDRAAKPGPGLISATR